MIKLLHQRLLYYSLGLFIVGSIGVLSLLLMPFNYSLLPSEALEFLNEMFTDFQLRIMTTINPFIYLIVSTIIGTYIYRNNPSHSYIQSLYFKVRPKIGLQSTITSGLTHGIILGLLMTVLYIAFFSKNSNVLLLESNSPSIPLITKVLYGGITEEIIVRWGWLSGIYVVSLNIIKNKRYAKWIAIVFSSILFGVGHIANVFFIEGIDLLFMITYIVFLNFIIGVSLGYLFIEKNIESSIIAHITFHLLSTSLLFVYNYSS